jgi:salicylate hydroxylase
MDKGTKFNIIVCGGVLVGLACAMGLAQRGHKVTVRESTSALNNEVGADIQIPPNAVRVLDAYGLRKKLEAVVTLPSVSNMRRHTGEILSSTKLDPLMTVAFGYPYWLIHCADCQRILF